MEKSSGGQQMPFSHKIGDCVMYRQNSICRILDIRTENMSSAGPKSYYVMKSVYDDNTVIYVPTDSKIADNMQHLLSVDEINAIIDNSEKDGIEWIEDSKQRPLVYKAVLARGDRTEILRLVKILSLHKLKVERQKRKFYACDEQVLSVAERVVTEEFAFVLGIQPSEVIPYIMGRIKSADWDEIDSEDENDTSAGN